MNHKWNKKKTLLLLLLTVFIGEINAQANSGTSGKSWEWEGHNNWFLPTGREGHILNQRTGQVINVQDPNSEWGSGISGYEGVTCASDDNGKLLFFSNGIKAWRADGTVITDKIWAGTECGYQANVGTSAMHGVMTVRHPLTPSKYYIITIDDIVNQGVEGRGDGYHQNSCQFHPFYPTESHGISYAIIDSSANLIHSSQPIETNITSGQLGQLRTTEGMAATFHANGVDIWVTFHPLWAKHVVSYLLTCEGFVTQPVVSGEGLVPYTDINQGVGSLDFTQDGSKLALGVDINNYSPQIDSKNAFGTINLYDFDNKTGEISNRMALHHNEWRSGAVTNVVFGPNGKWLHYGAIFGGKLDISSNDEATIRGTYQESVLSIGGFNGASITYDGQLKTSLMYYADAGIKASYSSNSMYIPPSEEPDIVEVGTLCDTASIKDLSTFWAGNSLSAEDSLYQRHSYFLLDSNDVKSGSVSPEVDVNSASIIDEKTGVFDPKKAGVGRHRVVFTYCAVNDTIDIVVNSCGEMVTGIGNVFNSTNQFKIYPNPTSKNLIVEIAEITDLSDLSISILDIQNNVVHQEQVTGSTQSIDVINWAAGIYFLQVLDGSDIVDIRKIVVNN